MNGIRCIDRSEVDRYLVELDAAVGDRNELQFRDSSPAADWHNIRAPLDAGALLSFSLHVVGWLPSGDWKLFHIDNSSWFDRVDHMLMAGILGDSVSAELFSTDKRGILFESSPGDKQRVADFKLAQLIFNFLMREQHAYVIGHGPGETRILGVQDGFVYFLAPGTSPIAEARELLEAFRKSDNYPEWVCELLAADQEALLNQGPVK